MKGMTTMQKTLSWSSKVTAPGGTAMTKNRLPRQRRPAWIAVGATLTGLAMLANVGFYRSAGHRVAVVQLARDVPLGQQVQAADLKVARVAVDQAVATVPKRQLRQVAGQRAAVGLRKGTLLAASQLTTQPYPPRGQKLVTAALKAGMVPLGLAPGWRVRAVFTTGTQDHGAAAATPDSSSAGAQSHASGDVPAVVDQVSAPDSEGTVPVSLLVADADAGTVARQAAAGLVVLVVTEKLG